MADIVHGELGKPLSPEQVANLRKELEHPSYGYRRTLILSLLLTLDLVQSQRDEERERYLADLSEVREDLRESEETRAAILEDLQSTAEELEKLRDGWERVQSGMKELVPEGAAPEGWDRVEPGPEQLTSALNERLSETEDIIVEPQATEGADDNAL